MNLSAEQIREILNLSPHPTCGLVRETFDSKNILPKSALPANFDSARPAGSVLMFMVTPETHIKLHRIRSDQMYHFYFGTPLEVLLMYTDGKAELKIVGDDIKNGMMPQLFIPANTFHVSRLHGNGAYSLLATTEWPGVAPQDVEVGDPKKLAQQYPSVKDEIAKFVRY